MWILINTLQFLVFIGAVWQIDYTRGTQLFLTELKKIVFGEFVDDLKIGEKISDALNISDKDKSEDDSDEFE